MQENVFFAVVPDPRTGEVTGRRIAATRRKYALVGRPIPADRLHISLHNISALDTTGSKASVAAACNVVEAFKFPAFDVTFDRALSFRHHGLCPYVLTGGTGLETLRCFHEELGQWLSDRLGVRLSRAFTPHLTLLYDNKLIPAHNIVPITWTVTEFVLIRSQLGLGRYDLAGCWKLT
jgi:2'-5' RNA ligase